MIHAEDAAALSWDGALLTRDASVGVEPCPLVLRAWAPRPPLAWRRRAAGEAVRRGDLLAFVAADHEGPTLSLRRGALAFSAFGRRAAAAWEATARPSRCRFRVEGPGPADLAYGDIFGLEALGALLVPGAGEGERCLALVAGAAADAARRWSLRPYRSLFRSLAPGLCAVTPASSVVAGSLHCVRAGAAPRCELDGARVYREAGECAGHRQTNDEQGHADS